MLLEQCVCRHAPVFQQLALRLGWCDRTVFLLRSAPFRSTTTARAWSKRWPALKTAPSWWTACTAWPQPRCWAWARSRRAAMPSRPSSRSPATKGKERSWGSLRWGRDSWWPPQCRHWFRLVSHSCLTYCTQGLYTQLACSKYGSRLLEAVWSSATISQRQSIAEQLGELTGNR